MCEIQRKISNFTVNNIHDPYIQYYYTTCTYDVSSYICKLDLLVVYHLFVVCGNQ